MTYIAHVFTASVLFLSSLWGGVFHINEPIVQPFGVTDATSSVSNPCRLSNGYVVKGDVVCAYGRIVKGADAKTFTEINSVNFKTDRTFSKDANAVYADGKILSGVDPATFQVLNYGYVKDKNGVYCSDGGSPDGFVELQNADPKSFVTLGYSHDLGVSDFKFRLAKDNHAVYSQCVPILGSDPATFIPLISYELLSPYAKDRAHVWYLDSDTCSKPNTQGYCSADMTAPVIISGADPATFTLIRDSSGFLTMAKDAFHIYQKNHVVLTNADPASFNLVLSESGRTTEYEKDADNVYWGVQTVSGADPKTFSALDCGNGLSASGDRCDTYDSQDKNHFYLWGRVCAASDCSDVRPQTSE